MTFEKFTQKYQNLLGLFNVMGLSAYFLGMSYLMKDDQYLTLFQFAAGVLLLPFFITGLFAWIAPERAKAVTGIVIIYLIGLPIFCVLFMDFQVIYFAGFGIALGILTILLQSAKKSLFIINILGLFLWVFLIFALIISK